MLQTANPVVHFEIIGKDPATLRRYYGGLFGWTFALGDADPVSAPGEYGFQQRYLAGRLARLTTRTPGR